jgi:NO-binding membrane sensor protein with MHYT domain
MAYLVRGNIDRAVDYHPVSLILAFGIAVWAVWLIGIRKRGWRPPSIKAVNIALIAAGVLLLGVWFTRMAAGTLPPV